MVGGKNDGDESAKGGEHFLPVTIAKNIQSCGKSAFQAIKVL